MFAGAHLTMPLKHYVIELAHEAHNFAQNKHRACTIIRTLRSALNCNLTGAALRILNAANFDVAGDVKRLPPAEGLTGSLKVDGTDSGRARPRMPRRQQLTRALVSNPPSSSFKVIGFGGDDGGTPERERRAPAPTE